MALTTVAELRSTLGVGTLYSDSVLESVCDAADAVLLPMLWTNTTYNIAHSNTATTGTLYFDELVEKVFYVGQTVVISGNGSKHNGSKTLTGVGDYNITYNISGNNNTPAVEHPVQPFGVVTADTYVDWSADQAVQNAALMISVEIWQARTATLSGSNAVDFQPSPYRMSAQLLAKVRGLISHALAPTSMVG
ncbi:hypothetical protein UFOVP709_13 [uncultured Caudovirales phage]|uniref:Gp6 domain containing protein n=2 Tax=uncultured Caudovirales phage TaxID=2100421 RepID=A0A6J5NMF2_9CAUD|nr:hypothetical protein UFOVP709_13 [uncultured Caudovirales phage]